MLYSILVGFSVAFIVFSLRPYSVLDKSFDRQAGNFKEKVERIQEEILVLGEKFFNHGLSRLKVFRKMEENISDLLNKLWRPPEKAGTIIGTQWLVALSLMIIGLILSSPIVFLLGIPVIFGVPMYLKSKWNKRKSEMAKNILSLAELTAVGVSAGLAPIEALQLAIQGRKNYLFDEIQLAINRVRLGVPANEAFLGLSKKVDLQELHAFIDQLVQAIETGARGFSESVIEIVRHLREIRQAKIEEIAGKTEAKLLFPLLMFFAAVISFLLGPLTITFMEMF